MKSNNRILKNKMSRAKGLVILFSIIAGVLLFWASVSSYSIFALSIACFALAIYLYKKHVSEGGITLQEAWNESKVKK